MSRIDDAFAFIEVLDRQEDVASLLASFRTLVAGFGCEYFCVGDAGDPEIHHLDPARHFSHALAPRPGAGSRGPDRQRPFATAFGETVFGDGLTISIFGADGSMCAVAIAAGPCALGKRDEAALHMAVLYFHARFMRLRGQSAAPRARLTPRERECLSWVASGKTDWEISRILAISEQTTHEYVRNALTKLGAATRAQAVATAMLEHQILQ